MDGGGRRFRSGSKCRERPPRLTLYVSIVDDSSIKHSPSHTSQNSYKKLGVSLRSPSLKRVTHLHRSFYGSQTKGTLLGSS